jgi:hypothetical protein
MHGFINSPALAKLVALQLVDEQVQQGQRGRPRKARRLSLRTRLTSRRTPRRASRPVPTGQLVEDV